MQLCQEEELVWHGATRNGNCFGAPVYRHAACFKDMPASTIVTGSLQIVVWHECEIAVGIGIAISKLDYVPIGFETLDTTRRAAYAGIIPRRMYSFMKAFSGLV